MKNAIQARWLFNNRVLLLRPPCFASVGMWEEHTEPAKTGRRRRPRLKPRQTVTRPGNGTSRHAFFVTKRDIRVEV